MTKTSRQVSGIGTAALILVFVGGAISLWPDDPGFPIKAKTAGQIARIEKSKADAVYNTPEAEVAYKGFIEKHKDSPDKQVQDQVGAARIRLAYRATKKKDWKKARAIFQQAAAEYKGTGDMRSDFGGIKDQALYHAAVTLSAEGKEAEAKEAYLHFMRTQQHSPLVHAVYKRLVKLEGKATAELDALLQAAVTAQEKHIRFETSVCGPKAIAYVLRIEGKGEVDYRKIARDCGTTDAGTTIEGLRKGFKAQGLDFYGFRVSRPDLEKIELPAILATDHHYVVVTKVESTGLRIFDPTSNLEKILAFDKMNDPQFNAVLLLKSAPKI